MRNKIINLMNVDEITNSPYGKKDEYVSVTFMLNGFREEIVISISDFESVKLNASLGKNVFLSFLEIDGNGVYKLV